MIINTHRLFVRLLSALQITTVCDVGSMDGADALVFRRKLPGAAVYAFEPNPHNLLRMQANPAFRQRNVELVPVAATNYDGEAEFFLVEADYGAVDAWRGTSSLYRRSGEHALAGVVRVRTARLDTFLADRCPPHARVALWIDTEGAAYEVIEGLTALAGQVQLLHVEVETSPCIGANQKLYPQVQALLEQLGFTELATDAAPSQIQFNTLFVRRHLPAAMQVRVKSHLVRARLRYLTGRALNRLCPACLRWRATVRRPGTH
jgi:FkbM family methyltransferase